MDFLDISEVVCPLITHIISSTHVDLNHTVRGNYPSPPSERWAEQQKIAAAALYNMANIDLVGQCENLFISIGKHARALYDTTYYDRKSLQDALVNLKAHVAKFPLGCSQDFDGIFLSISKTSATLDKTIEIIQGQALFRLKGLAETEKSLYHEMLPEVLLIKIDSLFLDVCDRQSYGRSRIDDLKILHHNYEPLLYEKIFPALVNTAAICKRSPFRSLMAKDKLAILFHSRYVDLNGTNTEYIKPLCRHAINAQHLAVELHSKKIYPILSQLPYLFSLELTLIPYLKKAFKPLVQLSKLQSLCIEGHRQPELHDIQSLGRLTSLQILSIRHAYKLKEVSLQAIAPLTSLRALKLYNCGNIVGGGLDHLSGLQNLRQLEINFCAKIGNKGLQWLTNVTDLRELSVYDYRSVKNESLQELGHLTQLKQLTCGSDYLTDDALDYLSKLTQLEILQIDANKITEEGINTLRGQLKNATITRIKFERC